MAIDFSAGLGDEREFLFAKRPDDPEMRESVNAWIWDEGAEVGMPRIGIEAVGETWDAHQIQMNISYADGRVFNLFGTGESGDPIGHDGQARVLRAGPLAFELIEPFKHWKMHFDGLVVPGTVEAMMDGGRPTAAPTVPAEIDIDIVAAVPAWENGAMLAEAKRVLDEQDEGALMGGPRFEQLSRVTGRLRIGDDEHAINGGALRVRRQGVRRLGTFRGHAWQSAVFPSGKAFGYIVYPDRTDGLPTYNEGYLFDGDGALIPAWVVKAPWLGKMQHRGQDVSVVMETERGTVEIKAESVVSCFSVMGGVGPDGGSAPVLQQTITRYTWDGETANGMMERSMPGNMVSR